MRVVEGRLTLLGNSTMDSKQRIYSVIQIGDHLLQKIYVVNAMDSFLQQSLNQPGTTRLHLLGKFLMGVQLPNGKLYCYSNNMIWPLVVMGCGVPLIPFFGFGLYVIWLGVAELRRVLAGKSLQSMGGIPCSL